MGWLSQRAWQLGIAIVLATVAAALIYGSAADDPSAGANGLTLVAFVLFALAMAVPLITKAIAVTPGAEDEDERS